MERILVADDGSDAAFRAVEIAAELAAKMEAELIAIAVVDPACIRAEDVSGLVRSEKIGDAEAVESLVGAAADYLARCQSAARRAGVVHYREARRASDNVALEIIDFAVTCKADLIVVGSRGKGRLSGLLLGSVSQKLATHAPCSVLIAR